MTPVFLTLSEHDSAVYSIGPNDPEPLRKAASELCNKSVQKRLIKCGKNSNEKSALEFTARRCDECIEISVSSWYHVGFDWAIPGLLGVQILPKLNQETKRVNILGMLREALSDPNNLNYIDGLLKIDFSQPCRSDSEAATELDLFIATAYLSVLTRIVRKGLKRSFCDSEEIFRRKIRGSIQFSKTISGRRTPNISDRLCCRRQDFSADTPTNHVLKRALRLIMRFLQAKVLAYDETKSLVEKSRVLLRAFDSVSDKKVSAADADNLARVQNPFFRDYHQALFLAQKILRMESFSYVDSPDHGSIPVHWIDMPKLFELYVYAKLREKLRSSDNIRYQFGANRQYPDFLCKANQDALIEKIPPFFVADAKYKPRYADGNSHMVNDIRQLSGYARLSGVLDEFQNMGRPESDRNQILPCVIVYSDQNLQSEELDWERLDPVCRWESFYKIGIRLPERVS